ncbi:Protein F56D3.1 [Aphelenchoides avenae]|nr:Protein F56D3.1 [Aphelenchus avenae]
MKPFFSELKGFFTSSAIERALEVGGYRDGVQKAIFDEVKGNIPPDFEASVDNANDVFGAYDDNGVQDGREAPLLIPRLYRNDTPEEIAADRAAAATTPRPIGRTLRPLVASELTNLPPVTVRTTPPTLLPPGPPGGNQFVTRPPLPPQPPAQPHPPAPQLRPAQPFFPPQQLPQQPPRQLPQFAQPQPQPAAPSGPPFNVPQRPPVPQFQPVQPPNAFRPRPQFPQPPPQAPPRPQFTPPPQQFTPPPQRFTQPPQRPQFVPPQQPQRPQQQPQFVPPQQPQRPPPQQPQRPPQFVPPQQPQRPPQFVPPQQRPQPQFPGVAQTPRPPPQFRPDFQRPPPPTQPPRFSQPAAPQPQQQTRPPLPPFRPLRPFQQPPPQPQQNLNPPRDPSGLRNGVCHQTIFYLSAPASAFDNQQVFSHFAVVVSVDQCARTCHEFNCAAALFDPATRRCQFNPGTAFTDRSCPVWPNPLYRNNIPIGTQVLRVSCVTCQRRRRRITNQQRFLNLQPQPNQPFRVANNRGRFEPRVIGHSVANAVHGVLLEQPKSIAVGFGPSASRENSFIKLSKEEHEELEQISDHDDTSEVVAALTTSTSAEHNRTEEEESTTPSASAELLKSKEAPVKQEKEAPEKQEKEAPEKQEKEAPEKTLEKEDSVEDRLEEDNTRTTAKEPEGYMRVVYRQVDTHQGIFMH